MILRNLINSIFLAELYNMLPSHFYCSQNPLFTSVKVFLIPSSKLRLFGLLIILLNTACEQGASPIKGTLIRNPDFQSDYIGTREVDIWLPTGYPIDSPYAVIYMHDAQMLFDASSTWNGQEWGVDEVLNHLITSKEVRPAIVVSSWNAGPNRRAEYMPQKAFETLPPEIADSLYHLNVSTNHKLFPKEVYSDNYLRFMIEELKPYVDKTYSVDASQKSTLVMGSSMGGLISMYAMLEYPEVFGGAACLSTHWIGISSNNHIIPLNMLRYLDQNLMDPGKNLWYFDYGTETLDQYYETYQLRADSVFLAAGFGDKDLLSRKFKGHKHDENSWRSRLHIPLKFLLSN